MIRRNDLAKQFSLVVQQEIINHNKSIDNTNSSINSINNKIKLLENNIENIKSKLQSIIQNITTKFDNIQNLIEIINKEKPRDLLDIKNKNINIDNNLLILKKELANLDKKIDNYFEKFIDLGQRFSVFESNYKQKQLDIKNEIDLYFTKSLLEIQKTKQEILSIPSEAKAVKEEIEKKLEIDRIDFQGLLRELQVFKKQMFVIEKNIENLYTQIERIKQAK